MLRASRGEWKAHDKTDSKLDLRFSASDFTHRELSATSKTLQIKAESACEDVPVVHP